MLLRDLWLCSWDLVSQVAASYQWTPKDFFTGLFEAAKFQSIDTNNVMNLAQFSVNDKILDDISFTITNLLFYYACLIEI